MQKRKADCMALNESNVIKKHENPFITQIGNIVLGEQREWHGSKFQRSINVQNIIMCYSLILRD